MTAIDQVMVRKVGGWNMVSVAWWIERSEQERQSFIEQDAVQFFATGVPVSVEAAQAAFGLDSSPVEAAIETPEIRAQEIAPVKSVMVVYKRQVIPGPIWLVERFDSTSGGHPLEVIRGRNEPDAYNLDSVRGSACLSADLMADSLGFEEDPTQIFDRQALDYFRLHHFEEKLGPRPWEVSSMQIKEWLQENPHLQLVD